MPRPPKGPYDMRPRWEWSNTISGSRVVAYELTCRGKKLNEDESKATVMLRAVSCNLLWAEGWRAGYRAALRRAAGKRRVG